MAAFMRRKSENNQLYVWEWLWSSELPCDAVCASTVLALCLVLLFGACSENQARKSPATSYQKAPIRATVTVAMETCTGKRTDGMSSCHGQGRTFKKPRKMWIKQTTTALRLNNQALQLGSEWTSIKHYYWITHTSTFILGNTIDSLHNVHVPAKVSLPYTRNQMVWF